jgi:uncharacterized protein (DUF111 family)
LLKGVPLAPSTIKAELTTPTGAAILTSVVKEFTATPAMTIEKIGHGAGTKDFLEQANILRLFVGVCATPRTATADQESDSVMVLETNLDDVAPEMIGFCTEQLFAAGAHDVFVVHGQMKKGRPGLLVSVICDRAKVAALEAVLFRETATFGVRRYPAERSKLRREAIEVETPWGPVKAKRGWREDGFEVLTPEYEDCARLARELGIPLRDVYAAVRR